MTGFESPSAIIFPPPSKFLLFENDQIVSMNDQSGTSKLKENYLYDNINWQADDERELNHVAKE